MEHCDCGLLNRTDARAWKHWWAVRGHIAVVRSGPCPKHAHAELQAHMATVAEVLVEVIAEEEVTQSCS